MKNNAKEREREQYEDNIIAAFQKKERKKRKEMKCRVAAQKNSERLSHPISTQILEKKTVCACVRVLDLSHTHTKKQTKNWCILFLRGAKGGLVEFTEAEGYPTSLHLKTYFFALDPTRPCLCTPRDHQTLTPGYFNIQAACSLFPSFHPVYQFQSINFMPTQPSKLSADKSYQWDFCSVILISQDLATKTLTLTHGETKHY